MHNKPVIAALLSFALCAIVVADVTKDAPVLTLPTTQSTTQHMDKDYEVVIEAVVESAEWSKSGKVMVIKFKGVEISTLSAILFEGNRKRFDESFNGDFARSITGQTVRFRGQLTGYDGRDKKRAGEPQMILESSSAVTIESDLQKQN
jgi:hypothetical protein